MADKDELLSHNYDGIQEYDNDLPKWWIYLFIICVAYGVFYFVNLHLGSGLDQEEQLAVDMKELHELQEKIEQAKPKVESSDEQLLALANQATALEEGKKVFTEKCVACHGAQGQGIVGPNLTDDYWIHGGKISDIRNLIISGVPAKGMLAWKGILSDQKINEVTAYIWSLKGSNPANPKKPEGELVATN